MIEKCSIIHWGMFYRQQLLIQLCNEEKKLFPLTNSISVTRKEFVVKGEMSFDN